MHSMISKITHLSLITVPGTEYAGQWSKNRFHGEGTRRFNNGNVYNGNYVDGRRQGQGKCYFANGGEFVDYIKLMFVFLFDDATLS